MQTSSLSHHPPVSYIWTTVMTDEYTNFRCNSRNNAAYLWVRTRCNEKQPEGNNDDQITEKEKLNRHRKQANTSSVPKSYGFSTRAAASTASWASRVADSDVKLWCWMRAAHHLGTSLLGSTDSWDSNTAGTWRKEWLQKQIIGFCGRSAGRETDSSFLSPDSREDRGAAALFKGHCETASRGGILMPGLTPLMKTQRRQPHHQTHTSARLPPAAS